MTLQQNLYEQLGEDALVALTTDDVLLGKELGQKGLVIVDGGDESSPALMIKSPFKVYKNPFEISESGSQKEKKTVFLFLFL